MKTPPKPISPAGPPTAAEALARKKAGNSSTGSSKAMPTPPSFSKPPSNSLPNRRRPKIYPARPM